MSQGFSYGRRGLVITPSDTVNQSQDFSYIICLTAGNLVFRLIDAGTNAESASITLAMTAGQKVDLTPLKVMVASTGSYLGIIAG